MAELPKIVKVTQLRKLDKTKTWILITVKFTKTIFQSSFIERYSEERPFSFTWAWSYKKQSRELFDHQLNYHLRPSPISSHPSSKNFQKNKNFKKPGNKKLKLCLTPNKVTKYTQSKFVRQILANRSKFKFQLSNIFLHLIILSLTFLLQKSKFELRVYSYSCQLQLWHIIIFFGVPHLASFYSFTF